jgi:hypothetical protein
VPVVRAQTRLQRALIPIRNWYHCMRSTPPSPSARRARRQAERRSRRRPVLVVGALALAAATAAGFAGASPVTAAPTQAGAPVFVLASSSSPLTATVGAPASVDAVDATAEVLATAQTSLDAAASVTGDIQASGLDVGEPDPTVDTAELEAALDRLEAMDGALAPFADDVAEDVASLIAPVDERVSQLRGSLEGAQQRKAEEEAAAAAAAEQARLEAEAAEAAAAARPSSGGGGSSAPAPLPVSGGGSGDNSPAGAQAAARGMLANYGWGDDQFGCLVSLWNKESGWNYQAYNSSSGAFGIPQALPGSKMASAGADWQTNAATQVAWGLGYISGRYGSPCGAWGHSQSVGWY